MKLYDYLSENYNETYDWYDYTFGDADIPQIKGDAKALSKIWEHINEWIIVSDDMFHSLDAALIARIFTESLAVINKLSHSGNISVGDVADICSIYCQCALFSKCVMGGPEIYEKTQLFINNALADSVVVQNARVVDFSDIESVDLDDEWESL